MYVSSIFIFLFNVLTVSCSADMSTVSSDHKAKNVEIDVSKENKAVTEAIKKLLASDDPFQSIHSGVKGRNQKVEISTIVQQKGATIVVNSKEDFQNLEDLSDEVKSKSIELLEKKGIRFKSNNNQKDGIKINKALTGRAMSSNHKTASKIYWTWNDNGDNHKLLHVKYTIFYSQIEYEVTTTYSRYDHLHKKIFEYTIIKLKKWSVFTRNLTYTVHQKNGKILSVWVVEDGGYKLAWITTYKTTGKDSSLNSFWIEKADLYMLNANDPDLRYNLPPALGTVRKSLRDHPDVKKMLQDDRIIVSTRYYNGYGHLNRSKR